MPIFEYRCRDCGAVTELLVRSDTTPACEGCGSHALDKLMSAHSVGSPVGGIAPVPTCCGRERTGGTAPCGSPGGCCQQ